ncbi:MAG: glutamate racemase [Oscillospiraceae bacterium]|nr:glutamate racemase [Oscillospiraceae bacterium]
MNNKSIGVFDSGLGGLTAVKQIMKELPNENIIYFGDTGRVPYGTRSRDTILKYTRGDIRFLRTFDVKIIVIACGTASSAALPAIKDEFDIPIIGVIDAAVYAAVRATRNNKIGIIGTQGTIKSGEYEKQIKAYNSEMQTFAKACPLFVPIVENGHSDTQVARLLVEEYLEDIRNQGVDTLILGCTHYPLLEKVIREYMGDEVTLINSGAEVAKYLKKKLGNEDMLNDGEKIGERYRYYVSDDIAGFEELGGIFLEREINGQVNKIDIEKY